MKVKGLIPHLRPMHEVRWTILGLGLLCAVFLLGESAEAKTFKCPPDPKDVIETAKIAGAENKIDKLVKRQTDKKGNKVELWCIDDSWFGKRYVPKDGKPVWVGKCAFLAGKNNEDKCSPPKKGEPTVWEKLSWTNSTANGTKDWHYDYIVSTNELTIWKTKSHLEKGKGEDGKEYEWPVVDEKIEPPWYKDKGIEDWNELPQLVDYPCTPTTGSGWAGPQFDVIPEQTGPIWQYGLYVPTLGGSGTVEDPFFGFSLKIDPGDVWSISGAGIHDPFVTGDAILPEWGAWTIVGQGSDFVTYQATQGLVLPPGFVISGLAFYSEAPAGQVSWVGYGTGMNYDSSTTGPVPEPSTLLLLGSGVVGVIGFGRKRLLRKA